MSTAVATTHENMYIHCRKTQSTGRGIRIYDTGFQWLGKSNNNTIPTIMVMVYGNGYHS